MRKRLNAFIEFFYFPFLRFIPLKTFKYAACGGTTVLAEIIVFFLAYQVLFNQQDVSILSKTFKAEDLAFGIGFLVSFPLGFTLNKFIVFTESQLRGRTQLFRYGISVLGSLLLNFLLFKLFIDYFNWFPTPSKLVTTLLVIIYSYFAQQYFSFRVSKANNGQDL